MIRRYPVAQINTTSVPNSIFGKFIGDKLRIQLKHLRELARTSSLLVFHCKSLSQKRCDDLQKISRMVKQKYPDDQPTIAPEPQEDVVEVDEDGCDSITAQASNAAGGDAARDRFGIPMRFSKEKAPTTTIDDESDVAKSSDDGDGIQNDVVEVGDSSEESDSDDSDSDSAVDDMCEGKSSDNIENKASGSSTANSSKPPMINAWKSKPTAADIMKLANSTAPIPPEALPPSAHVLLGPTYWGFRHS